MIKKLISILLLAVLVLGMVDLTEAIASNRGHRRGGHSGSATFFHRKGFDHHHRVFNHQRFIHRKFIHRPVVISKFHYPYYYRSYYYPYRSYYYPYRSYSSNYGRGYSYYTPSYATSSLSITAIVDMARRGVPDDVIIDEIRRTNSVFSLSGEIIAYLKDNNVSDRVIDYMMGRY